MGQPEAIPEPEKPEQKILKLVPIKKELTPKQKLVIEFVANAGFVTSQTWQDGCVKAGITSQTLNNWKRLVPNFLPEYNKRRNEILEEAVQTARQEASLLDPLAVRVLMGAMKEEGGNRPLKAAGLVYVKRELYKSKRKDDGQTDTVQFGRFSAKDMQDLRDA